MPTIRELVPEVEQELSKREEVKALSAMLKAALTPEAAREVGDTVRNLGLMRELGPEIGLANARLFGRISNGQGGARRVLYPAVYYKTGRKHRYMVSAGRVVGQPNMTVLDITAKGYRFGGLLK